MTIHWASLVVGAWIGAAGTLLVISLCTAAAQADRRDVVAELRKQGW